MSSNFSPEDFHPLYLLAQNLLSAVRTAPKKYLDLQAPLQSLKKSLAELELQSKNPLSVLRQRCSDRRREWLSLLDSLGNVLLDIQDKMKRASRSVWSRWFRYAPKRSSLRYLKRELRILVSDVEIFIRSLGLSPLGRQEPVLGRIERLLLEEVREERTGERRDAVLAAHETDDPRAWREVSLFLNGRGIPEEELWRHDARLKQLLHWVVKNEPDITAAQEMAEEEYGSRRRSLAYTKTE